MNGSQNSRKQEDGVSRRTLLNDVASLATLGTAAAVGMGQAAAGTKPEVKEEIPGFKFDIEDQKGWEGPGGSAKEATVEEFPVSQSMAGVSMRLKPGGLRELHWHAIAAEWAYMLKGRCRVTVISPDGHSETSDFGPGDVWYFPKGHGHSLQGLGPEECHFLLVFDSGHFSEFGTFSVTDWISKTPPAVLSRNLGLPDSAFAKFPKGEVYIAAGEVPPAMIGDDRNANVEPAQLAHKFRLDAMAPSVFEGGEERIVSSGEFPIQTTLTAARMNLKPGSLREMHWHPNADEWQYYISGRARVTVFGSHGRVKTEELAPGQIAFIKQGYGHYIEQVGDDATKVLILFNSPVYQEISISSWLGANPEYVLRDNFGVPAGLVRRLPRRALGILGRG